MSRFSYSPSPQILQWLSQGQLASRWHRSLRLWVLLNKLYGRGLASELPATFDYPQLRDRLFSTTHPTSNRLRVEAIERLCLDSDCICQKSGEELISEALPRGAMGEWQQEALQQTGWSDRELKKQLQQRPFATVHRSLRDDLKHLSKQSWLKALDKGRYELTSPQDWQTPPTTTNGSKLGTIELSKAQTWELLRVLESVSFVQPELEAIIQLLWEQNVDDSSLLNNEPQKRIFVHLDYILPDEEQDRVDDYQEQIQQLWQSSDGGVIQFTSWIPKLEKKVKSTVYPVCLHYVRRAKYLTAYGEDPYGKFGWHNYRLDRISSDRLKILDWASPQVPEGLKQLQENGQLPTSVLVEEELEAAWGFNFYFPKELLIMRFGPKFARWYAENTVRHPTFKRIAYTKLSQLIRKQVPDSQEQEQILEILKHRSQDDCYYRAWIRQGDINILMRLQAWRPNGEVIAPISLRQRLYEDTLKELDNYSR